MAIKSKTMLLIKPDGSETEVEIPNETQAFLETMYRLIGNGCHTVQVIGLGHGRLMWMDENAKLSPTPEPVNPRATRMIEEAGGIPGNYILGNVLIQTRRQRR
jgi:hypothetical protein